VSQERYDRQVRIWGTKGQQIINKIAILIVGAGGTGCEIIKNLTLLGFGEIHIVDLDIIEISNLNRQFFFQDDDVGKYKAEVAAKKAKILNPAVKIFYYNEKIQNVSQDIFLSCDYFISALDNIAARLYLNQKAVDLNKPLLDCGTEGFLGHVQVIIPRKTPCLVCQNLWVHPEMNFKCTYAINPRTPLDCALEARDKFYIQKNRLPDPDNDKDIQILLGLAEEHAKKYNIIGVNTETVKDSLKGTVESIITTNSIIGSVLVNELLKLALMDLDIFTKLELKIINFFQFQGRSETGWSIPLERNENCPVCSLDQITILVDEKIPLIQLMQKINEKINNFIEMPLMLKDNKIVYREKIHLNDKNSPIKDNEFKRLIELETRSIGDIFKQYDSILIKDESTGMKLKIKLQFK
jgi:ubiquitin-activating enzyme E1 C